MDKQFFNRKGETEMSESQAKQKIYDSVFVHLFSDPENQLKAYQSLHPEDTTSTVDDIRDVTLGAVLLNQMYNDLGFVIGNRLLFLIEAQSTWCDNMAYRSLLYVSKTLQEYTEGSEQNIYGERAVQLPYPELYVLYTGDKEHWETEINLADVHWGGISEFLNVRVKVLYGNGKDNILAQYAEFTRVYKKYRKLHGTTVKAVRETLKECIDRGILADYLYSKREEVTGIMMSLFDKETNMKHFGQSERMIGREERDRELIEKMLRDRRSVAEIHDFCGFPMDQILEVQESMLAKS